MAFSRADLPQFTVRSVEKVGLIDDSNIAWALHGELSSTAGIPTDSWCYLLHPNQTFAWAGTFSLTGENSASFDLDDKEDPGVLGLTLAQLGAYWQPSNIWMVEDGPEGWSEDVFVASDAILRGDGDRIPDRILSGGWDHEHCALCNIHIDPGDRFFYSREYAEFLCVRCYERYVPTRDIGFVFE